MVGYSITVRACSACFSVQSSDSSTKVGALAAEGSFCVTQRSRPAALCRDKMGRDKKEEEVEGSVFIVNGALSVKLAFPIEVVI